MILDTCSASRREAIDSAVRKLNAAQLESFGRVKDATNQARKKGLVAAKAEIARLSSRGDDWSLVQAAELGVAQGMISHRLDTVRKSGRRLLQMAATAKEDAIITAAALSGATAYLWIYDLRGEEWVKEYTSLCATALRRAGENECSSSEEFWLAAYLARVLMQGAASPEFDPDELSGLVEFALLESEVSPSDRALQLQLIGRDFPIFNSADSEKGGAMGIALECLNSAHVLWSECGRHAESMDALLDSVAVADQVAQPLYGDLDAAQNFISKCFYEAQEASKLAANDEVRGAIAYDNAVMLYRKSFRTEINIEDGVAVLKEALSEAVKSCEIRRNADDGLAGFALSLWLAASLQLKIGYEEVGRDVLLGAIEFGEELQSILGKVDEWGGRDPIDPSEVERLLEWCRTMEQTIALAHEREAAAKVDSTLENVPVSTEAIAPIANSPSEVGDQEEVEPIADDRVAVETEVDAGAAFASAVAAVQKELVRRATPEEKTKVSEILQGAAGTIDVRGVSATARESFVVAFREMLDSKLLDVFESGEEGAHLTLTMKNGQVRLQKPGSHFGIGGIEWEVRDRPRPTFKPRASRAKTGVTHSPE